jgi:S1-C subfamily serine protease
MKPDSGYPIAVRGDHEILVISGVLAADPVSDAAIVELRAEDLEPLALSQSAEVGDPAYCLSEPSGGRPYFSAGMVNRFAKDPDAKTADPRGQRMNVSTDWAPGSSGSAVLDAFGNAIGHVVSISTISGERKGNAAAPHYMAVRWATPAAHVLHLADPSRSPAETSAHPGPSR